MSTNQMVMLEQVFLRLIKYLHVSWSMYGQSKDTTICRGSVSIYRHFTANSQVFSSTLFLYLAETGHLCTPSEIPNSHQYRRWTASEYIRRKCCSQRNNVQWGDTFELLQATSLTMSMHNMDIGRHCDLLCKHIAKW